MGSYDFFYFLFEFCVGKNSVFIQDVFYWFVFFENFKYAFFADFFLFECGEEVFEVFLCWFYFYVVLCFD